MAWNTPADWDYKEVPGSEKMNQQIRDNLNYLKLSLPAGVIMQTARSSAPDQWLLCDGTAVSRSTYSDLFTAIGTTYGAGDGTTTFNLPNTKGRVLVGRNASETEFDVLGETGGAKTHTLTEAQIPSHTHIQNAHSHAHLGHTTGGTGGIRFDAAQVSNVTPNATTATNQNTGGGGSHNNLQPYLVINYIIKY